MHMCVYMYVSLNIYPQEYFYQSNNVSMYVSSKSQATVVVARLQIIRGLNFHCTHFSSSKTIYCNDMKGNIFQQNFSYL